MPAGPVDVRSAHPPRADERGRVGSHGADATEGAAPRIATPVRALALGGQRARRLRGGSQEAVLRREPEYLGAGLRLATGAGAG